MFGFRLVKDDQVGIVTKNMFGRKMLPRPDHRDQQGDRRPGRHPHARAVLADAHRLQDRKAPRDTHRAGKHRHRRVHRRQAHHHRDDCLATRWSATRSRTPAAFLENGGCKGPQIAVLRPGTYRINDQVFKVKVAPGGQHPHGKGRGGHRAGRRTAPVRVHRRAVARPTTASTSRTGRRSSITAVTAGRSSRRSSPANITSTRCSSTSPSTMSPWCRLAMWP